MAVKTKITLIVAVGLFFIMSPKSGTAASLRRPPYVRVAIIQGAAKINLAVRGSYQIVTLQTNQVLSRGKNLRTSRVEPTSAGVKIREMDFKVYGVKIIPAVSGSIYVNGRRFRGQIIIIREKNLTLLVVNNLDLEQYLKGVLRHEVSHRWPIDAIKAQAVVARTYAVYQTRLSRAKDYDLTSDIYSQVYGGKTSETLRTSVAVDRTQGEILTYRGEIFPTFYHATCGGHTEDASMLWKVNLSPLKGVQCEFCASSPHFKWHKELSVAEIEKKLMEQGIAISGLKEIMVQKRNNSGRVVTLRLVGEGNETEISGKDFRQLLNPNVIRSTNFDLEMAGDRLKIAGLGWGHGVGMCQWGAYFQSLQGKKYDQILEYYYPGSRLEKLR